MSERFLFSVDLENPYGRDPAALGKLVDSYLGFLARHAARATIFVVGEMARRHRDLLRRIAAAGHELACHSDRHVPLDRMDAAGFRDDVLRNLDAVEMIGAARPVGYRAPMLSLTAETAWAHEILAELGFVYSSSVLPARNPLYGWPAFGTSPRRICGVVELPVTLLAPLPVPLAGGVYFRVLPATLIERGFRKAQASEDAICGYFHPYDVDLVSQRHQDFARWHPFDLLLRVNRGAVIPRLERVMRLGLRIVPYREHVADLTHVPGNVDD